MEDRNLSHEESLKLIHTMINSAKNYYYESGMGALLWGFTNVICFLLAFADGPANKVAAGVLLHLHGISSKAVHLRSCAWPCPPKSARPGFSDRVS